MRRQAKREFLNRKPKAKPTWRRIGEKDGTPILEVTFKQPTPQPGDELENAPQPRRLP